MRSAAAHRHNLICASNALSDDKNVPLILSVSADEYLPEVEPMPGLYGNPVKWYDADRTEPYTKITPFAEKTDPSVEFVFKPMPLTVLTVAMTILAYIAMSQDVIEEGRSKQRLAVYASIAAFLLFSMIQFRDGPFIRPHPAFWRVVLGVNLLYEIALVFLLFQDLDAARGYMKLLDPSLGVQPPEKDYSKNCALTFTNVWDNIDFFCFAHIVGWFGKALILRDYWFCWILSVAFECAEYCLHFHLPNFCECWWDQWILDVLVCNWIGTYIGMKVCQYFEVKHYEWRSVAQTPGFKGKTKRVLGQFSPYNFTTFHWGGMKNFKSYCIVILLLTVFLLAELNPFYLKYLLWTEPWHPFVIMRVVGVFLCGLPAARELYEYMNDPRRYVRMGQHVWLMIATIATEVLIIVKWGDFPKPCPRNVKLFLSTVVAFLVAYPTVKFGVPKWRSYLLNRGRVETVLG